MTAATAGAIVLAAHGSSHPGAMAGLAAFRESVQAAYPDLRLELARTVGRKHGSAAAFGGARRVVDVLAGLAASGVRRVAVQSLHVVPGEEYHCLLAGLGRFLEADGGTLSVSVGAPLLASLADVEAVAGAVIESLPAGRAPGEGLVLMGHGAPPPGAGFYEALRERLSRLDPLARFGAMPRERGAPCPDILGIRDELLAAGVATAWLLPFFTVAGAHACCDLAGDKATSWRGILEASGIRCRPCLAGLIEREPFAAVWRGHLRKALALLG
uniref:Cobalamin biosynthesis protein CbiK, Co2+ chelatase n=1 Tax=Desulfovibrio sp. U5L TaxID=596152 RepID=I2PWV8_9BACT